MKNMTFFYLVFLSALLLTLLCSCKNDTIKNVPTVTLVTVSGISSNTATSGGNVTSDGGATVTVKGVCWGLNQSPSILGNNTENGTGTGSFTSPITGLSPGTTYYIRAYATNAIGTAYSGQETFTTFAALSPILTTTGLTAITSTTATSGGNITSDGGFTVTSRGVCWATGPNPTTANSKTIDNSGTGSFTSSLTGLTRSTTYYLRAYATNSMGTSYGGQEIFTTLAGVAELPTVTTTEVYAITNTTATSGGSVTSDGGSTIIANGVCWGIATPTINDNKTTDVTGDGTFTSYITGLTSGTTYFLRAYATNSIGTSYGNEVSFVPGTVTDIDGNVYHYIVIGTQTWLVENLKTTKYLNGDPIPNVTENTAWGSLTTGAYCWYDNDAAAHPSTYGALYNWYAVGDARKIAPAGWHVPTDDEWDKLVNYLGGYTVAGGIMKEAGTLHWHSPNTDATNGTGFTALPGGFLGVTFNNIGNLGYWWSATEYPTTDAWYRSLVNDSGNLSRFYDYKTLGLSVRCLRD